MLQWAHHDDAFVGVLVTSSGHFALLQQPSTDVGQRSVLNLLRSFHTPTGERTELNCPMMIVLS
jgi:hypothetical protein